MATLRLIEEGDATQEVQELYGQIEAGFGAGQVPNVYKVLANNPRVLAATVENRRRTMEGGRLDARLKEWLAWATVTLANNVFGIKVHTARLKKLGIANADILEALAVLQYFTGISTVINGLAMAEDVDLKITQYLRQTP